ncbi:MAG TPA: WD40 repeat domain-containing protein, partial [Myxococcota bacterium]|nr:WD40 repeat domain-containing protein [Myxococcota bacterium]
GTLTRSTDMTLSFHKPGASATVLNGVAALEGFHKFAAGSARHPRQPERLVTWAKDGTVCVWNLRQAAPTPTLHHAHGAPVVGCAFHPQDPDRMVSWSENGVLGLWDLARAAPLHAALPAHHGAIRRAFFLPELGWLASLGKDDEQVKLWGPDGTLRAQVDTRGSRVLDCRWLPLGLLTLDGSGDALLWRTRLDLTTRARRLATPEAADPVRGMLCDPGSIDPIITWGDGQSLAAWSVHGAYLGAYAGHTAPVRGARRHPHLRGTLVTWAADGELRLWEVGRREGQSLRGHTAAVSGCTFHPHDRRLMITWAEDNTLRLWRLRCNASPTSRPLTVDGSPWRGRVTSCRVDERVPHQLQVTTYDNTLRIFDFSSPWAGLP